MKAKAVLTLVGRMLQVVLREQVAGLASGGTVHDDQVSFGPPLQSTNPPQLSVYLVDLRENIKLGSQERAERSAEGAVVSRRAPYRMDCHYLISASAISSGAVPLHQHTLLYEATEALVRSQPLVPARILAGYAELLEWPESSRDTEIPMSVNPHEGFAKLAEFWGTIPNEHPWRPVVYVIVTIPVEHEDTAGIAMVRHRTTIYRTGARETARVEIGGIVFDRPNQAGVLTPRPADRARVFAVDAQSAVVATTLCDHEGRFVLQLPTEAKKLYAAAFGLGTTELLLISGAKEYTLNFL
jgi:hypothetical protein